MELIVKTFKASFSATDNRWHIKLDYWGNLEFDIQYIRISGFDTGNRRLAATIQEIEGEEVKLEWVGFKLVIKKWKSLEKKHLWDLWNPDKPRNLAKCVTVA